ncbi:CapA family protein [Paenarthrobacter nicotinovorans]|uniref:CapA family protein n=1 Tax=Paenarthrobacter nicotinovorans TaxID=29320 RepID=UPI00166A3A8A|nr:CapA family protein [Paenarthrobacter nicotinovorans]UKE97527.1 CapA family protein [Paenarthrobacter nicotinovorans]UKF02313.1 CapA family protein [Paenarthrobacter nicotinovorans]
MKIMGNLTSATRWIRLRRSAAPAIVVALAMTLGACGIVAENTDPDRSTAATSPAAESPMPTRTPAPNPTPGKGPACPELRCTSITVTGDMLVHTQLWQQARADAAAAGLPGYTFVPLLEGQRRYVNSSDLAICHQETPVATPEGPFSAYPSFNVPPQIVTASKDIGYQACTTASNHTIDRGTEGLLRTLDALDAAGLKHTGSYRTEAASKEILMLQTDAAKVAVIIGTYGHNGQIPEYPWLVDELDPATMIAKATQARALGADIVLGVMHAGDEYASEPNAQQQDVAHALVDSGQFTMIYGHHTHSVLPIENYKGTWIVYGLGNGITELSPWYVVNNEGLLVRAQFSQNAAGTWTASDLAWAPSVIVRDPYRWCSVASDAPQGVCATPAADAETHQRTQTVVESMGAASAGAHELLITKER